MKAEQFIQDHIRNCSNIEYKQGVYAPTYQPWLTPSQALKAVEMEREEIIEKVCDAFCKVRCKGEPPRSTCTSLGTCREYDDFKKYMEKQV